MKHRYLVCSLFIMIIMPIVVNNPATAFGPRLINVWGGSHSPSNPTHTDTVTISCSFSISSDVQAYLIDVDYKVNGGSIQDKRMTANEETGKASTTIGPFNPGDFVEYRIAAIAIDKDELFTSDYDPYSGFYSFTIPSISFVSWSSPAAGTITFPNEDELSFTPSFTKSTDVDTVKLYFNGQDMGVVTSGSPITFTYSANIDGTVSAVLKGYDGATEVASSTRSYNFRKIISEVTEVLLNGYEALGEKLYLILYDPSGDGSYSTFEESSSMSLGIGAEISAGVTTGLEIGVEQETNFFGLFKTGLDASTRLELSYELTAGFDVRYDITDTVSLTSNQESEDPDYIGSGYGDTYWGEAWEFHWLITTRKMTFFSGANEYSDGHMWYGISRSLEAIYNENSAPLAWKNQNAFHNNYPNEDIDWLGTVSADGGIEYTNTHEVETTLTTTQSVEIEFSSEQRTKLSAAGISVEASVEVSLGTKIYAEQAKSQTITTSYTINDDEVEDHIVQDIGIDKRFGTYVFRTQGDFSNSSKPLEHGTRDYISPLIGTPIVDLDSDDDGLSPTSNDSPIVTTAILDEDAIQVAYVYYSINDGSNWDTTTFTEQVGNPGVYEANIPVFPHGTTVLWYIQAWDKTGNTAIKKNNQGNYFYYTVINREPTVRIIYPNGGETLVGYVNITWQSSDPDNDDLIYSVGYNVDSKGWMLIASDLTDEHLIWDIRNFSDSNYVMIRVTAYDGQGGSTIDDSDYTFSIDNKDEPSASLLNPVPGFTYEGNVTIHWALIDKDNLVSSIELYYSLNGGASWIVINTGLDKAITSYDWNTEDIVYSNNVKLKIVANYEFNSTSEISEVISGIMTIDNRPDLVITLINPNGGEYFEDSLTISWTISTHSSVIYSCLLEYSSDGLNWETIASDVTESSYHWNVRSIPYGTNYRVRITVSGTFSGYSLISTSDVSQGIFTLDPDYEGPEINSNQEDECWIEHGTDGNELFWILNDRNPQFYSIYVNGLPFINDQIWSDGELIIFPFDDHEVGTYVVEIIANDVFNQQNNNIIIVNVEDTTSPQFIFASNDITHEINSPDKLVEWILSDVNPNVYSISINRTVIVSNEPWSDKEKVNLALNVNDLQIEQVGIYEIVITVTDAYGLFASDSVFVTIVDKSLPILTIHYPKEEMIFEIETNTADITYNYSINEFSPYSVIIMLNDVIVNDTGILKDLTPGAYHLTFVSEDAYGNRVNGTVNFFLVNIVDLKPSFQVLIISPNGGEIYPNSLISIVWHTINPFELQTTFNLQYSADGGLSWGNIVEDIELMSYNWNVSAIPAGINYIVKVIAKTVYNGELLLSEDTSDGTFTIVDPSLTEKSQLLSPGFKGPLIFISVLSLVIILKKRSKT